MEEGLGSASRSVPFFTLAKMLLLRSKCGRIVTLSLSCLDEAWRGKKKGAGRRGGDSAPIDPSPTSPSPPPPPQII